MRGPRAFGDRAPRGTVAVFSFVFATLLGLAWLKGIAHRALAAAFGWPSGEDAVGHVVHALDLGLHVRLALAASLMLIRRRAAGDLIAAIMLIDAVCMGTALAAMVAWASAVSGASMWSAVPFAIVASIAVILAVAFSRAGAAPRARMKQRSEANAPIGGHP